MIQPSSSGSHRFSTSPVYFTPLASSSSVSFGSSTRVTVNVLVFASPVLSVPRIAWSPIEISATSPFFTSCLNSEYGIDRPGGVM